MIIQIQWRALYVRVRTCARAGRREKVLPCLENTFLGFTAHIGAHAGACARGQKILYLNSAHQNEEKIFSIFSYLSK